MEGDERECEFKSSSPGIPFSYGICHLSPSSVSLATSSNELRADSQYVKLDKIQEDW